jgi:hypothetical protein
MAQSVEKHFYSALSFLFQKPFFPSAKCIDKIGLKNFNEEIIIAIKGQAYNQALPNKFNDRAESSHFEGAAVEGACGEAAPAAGHLRLN